MSRSESMPLEEEQQESTPASQESDKWHIEFDRGDLEDCIYVYVTSHMLT